MESPGQVLPHALQQELVHLDLGLSASRIMKQLCHSALGDHFLYDDHL